MKKVYLFLSIIIFCTFFLILKTPRDSNVVSFASWGSQSETKILKELLSGFEEETGVKVDFIHIPQNYFQKIHLLFASNLEPDVVFINNHYLKMYTDANLLEDLTPLLENKNSYHQVAIECLSDNNKLYAIPRDISALVLYVNNDILEKENISINNKIHSISELKNILGKLTKKEHYALNYEEDPLYWLYYLAANGGGALNKEANKIIINSKESINALNLYSDFINKYNYIPTKAQVGSMTSAQMFINGKLAMYLGGRWMYPKFKETITFNWHIIEFPSSEKEKVYVDASGWAISKKSKNKENAIKLVKYLSSEASINQLVKSGLITPARITNESKETSVFTEMLKNTTATPTNKSYGKINDILREKGLLVLSGKNSAKEAFDIKTIKELESLL